MKTKIVNGVEVIECVHCSGTGICKNARYRNLTRTESNSRNGVIWECSTCGSGLPGEVKLIPFDGAKATQPTCRVCGGTGIYRG